MENSRFGGNPNICARYTYMDTFDVYKSSVLDSMYLNIGQRFRGLFKRTPPLAFIFALVPRWMFASGVSET